MKKKLQELLKPPRAEFIKESHSLTIVFFNVSCANAMSPKLKIPWVLFEIPHNQTKYS